MSIDPSPTAGWLAEQPACPRKTVVAVVDRSSDEAWGCELHAADALDQIDGARIAHVRD